MTDQLIISKFKSFNFTQRVNYKKNATKYVAKKYFLLICYKLYNMGDQKSISALLGFKQEELALILQVSRSQLSLYELGKRSLPLHAMEKLALLVSQLQNPAVENEQNKNTTEVDKKVVQQLILKNAHQQLIIEKKITALLKKQNANLVSHKIITNIMEKGKEWNKKEIASLKLIATNREKKIKENTSKTVFQLEIKKEVLKFEEKLLKEKLTLIPNIVSKKEV